MAFLDSISFNGKSIRDFLTEIIEVRGRGKPRIRKRSSRIIGRHGDFTFGQTYAPRIIRISGYVEGASHATLMLNVDNIKNLFSMDDQILATGEESISDGVKYGKLVFGDETDRYYRAIYNGINVLTEISQRWFLNDLKRIQIELRCDDPFAYATSLSESTMAGSADEFKVFDLGTANNEVIIELSGSVTNPVIVEGDKVGIAHFDYDDDLTDVEVNTVAGSFEEIFGFRTRKSLTSQQSKAIQIVSKDNLFYDRGTQINGFNYTNFNPHQGTIIFWVKPYFDGDDDKQHVLFDQRSGTDVILLQKLSGGILQLRVQLSGTDRTADIAVTSVNFAAGTWQMVVGRWDVNNSIDASSNNLQLDLLGDSEQGNTSALGAVSAIDDTLSIGQNRLNNASALFDGLTHWQLYERALTDSELDDLFNSGAGVEPFVTPDTKLLSAGELSGGLPVSVQYPWVDNKFTDGDQEVDPSAEWVHTGASGSGDNTVVTNEGTIIKYDTQSAQLDWVGAADGEYTFVSTGALVNNQDYFYRLWFYADPLNASDELHLDIVGSSTVHTRRLDTGTDDMGVAFATGTWLYFEGTFEADGAVAHQFRFRKVNANGDATIYVDQMDVQVNLVNNGGMEGTYVAGLAPNWDQIGGGTPSEENTIVHSGSSSQKFVTGGSSTRGWRNFGDAAVNNTWYVTSVWLRGTTGLEDITILEQNYLPNGIVFSNIGTEWVKKSIIYKSTGTAQIEIRVLISAGGQTIYIDDASTIKLDEVTANAASSATPEIDSYSEEKFGQGLRIDGADVLSWAVKGNKNEGSIEVWLKPQFAASWEDSTIFPIIYELNLNDVNHLRLSYSWTSASWIFRKREAGNIHEASVTSQTFSKGDRIHLIGTYGLGGVKLYKDGILGATVNADTASLAGNPTVLYMSDEATASFPDSIIDEIYVYSRELSQQEVTAKFNAFKATKNDNAKIAMTKVLSTNDKLRIDTENEVIEFLDSSAGTFTNAIASMDAGSVFFKMNALKSVIYNKVAITNTSVVNKIKLNYLKRWL